MKKTPLIIILVVAVVAIVVVNRFDLLKGSVLQVAGNKGPVVLNVENCDLDCSEPSLIVTAAEALNTIELLVKNPDAGEVVYAQYFDTLAEGDRYEVAFTPDLCADYNYDSSAGRYFKASETTPCAADNYEYIVSGRTEDSDSPLFTEFMLFGTTER